MPIINLSQDDINRSKPPDAGWHKSKLVGVEEKPSKDKQSINWNFDFEIQNGSSEGRHAYTGVNSKAVGIVLIPMVAALNDIPVDQVQPTQIDTEKLIGKVCYIEVTDSTYEGRIVKKITGFSPDSKPPF